MCRLLRSVSHRRACNGVGLKNARDHPQIHNVSRRLKAGYEAHWGEKEARPEGLRFNRRETNDVLEVRYSI